MLFSSAIAFLGVASCGGGGQEAKPTSSLASTKDSARAFEGIQRAWDSADGSKPGALRPRLEAFLGKFPNDGRVPLARAYLAHEMMDAGDWAGADRTLALLRAEGPGATKDVATIAEARLLRHGKESEAALESLRPLVGKIVDATVRELFLEEITRDALEVHRDFEALAYMDAWIRGVGEDKRERTHAKLEVEIAKLPQPVLEQTYRAIRSNRGALGYGYEMERLIAERLAQDAVTRGDANLARWLLSMQSAQELGDAGIGLAEIATSKRGLTSASGRMVGLLVPTASVHLRDEAADVARGVAWALGLPRTDPGAGDALHLVTRDDGGDPDRTEAALEELAGEGAGILIAALDPRTADRAVTWAEKNRVPTLVLSTPDRVHPDAYSFVVAASRDEELSAIADELATRRVAKAAVVGDAATPILEGRGFPFFLPLVPCDVEGKQAGENRFPIADWEKQSTNVVVIAGAVECARDVIRELGTRRKNATVALTLEAASTTARAPQVAMLGVSAGLVPVLATRPTEATDPDVRAYMTQFGTRPSYWTALGRDAGTLARLAIVGLPLDIVSDPKAVDQRRQLARSRLGSAESALWTSDKRGFANEHVLKRALKVVDITPKAPARAP